MYSIAIFNNWNELFRLNNNSKTCSLLCWGIFRLSRSIQIDGHYMASRTIRELTWKEHIKLTENEIAKGIGIWFISRPYLEPWYLSTIHIFTPTQTMKIQSGAVPIELIWKIFKVNKSTLLELCFTKISLHMLNNISKKIMYQRSFN